MPNKDWLDWHNEYDDPNSRLSKRLAIVQQHIRRELDERHTPIRIISMCAGQGRDVIGVLAGHPRRDSVTATLVELDERNAAIARESATAAGLKNVHILQADASLTDTYIPCAPAEIVLACGIFGNIPQGDIRTTVEHLPQFCARGATVLWTRGARQGSDIPERICAWFEDRNFQRIAYHAPEGETFRVGAHRLVTPPRPLTPGLRLFRFFSTAHKVDPP